MVFRKSIMNKIENIIPSKIYILTGARLILSAVTVAKAATATTNIKLFMIIFYRPLSFFFRSSSSYLQTDGRAGRLDCSDLIRFLLLVNSCV